MIRIGIEADDLLFIHVREVYGHVFVDQVDFFQGQFPRSHLQ